MTLRDLINFILDFDFLAFFAGLFKFLFTLVVEHWIGILAFIAVILAYCTVEFWLDARKNRKELQQRHEEYTGRYYEDREDRDL